MPNVWILSSAIIGYLLGSLPFGYLVARAHGVDIFKAGSGNPGATNVKRVLGKKAGNTVLVLDILKGALATAWPLLPMLAAPRPMVLELVGVVAAVIGHSFSIFTKFKGGKGVATAAGGLIMLMPLSCSVGAVVWVLTFATTRYVSLGSVLAAVAVPVTAPAGCCRIRALPISVVATGARRLHHPAPPREHQTPAERHRKQVRQKTAWGA